MGHTVAIPKYEETPATIIKKNTKTVGMTRDEYISILKMI